MMNTFIRKNWKYFAFTVAGAFIGFAYWRFVGCRSGSCAITANWHTSVLFGSMIGFLAVPSVKKEKKTEDTSHTNETPTTEENLTNR